MKKPLLLVIFVCIAIIKPLFAQDHNLKELFLDGEYFFLYEDYEEALYSYNALYKKGFKDNANINYRIGQCFLNIPGEKSRAIPYLEKAAQNIDDKYSEGSFKEVHAPFDAQFFLGNAYRVNNQLDKAIAAYEKYKALIGNKDAVATALADKEIASCKMALEMMKVPVPLTKNILAKPINTPGKDYFPAVSADESVLAYNSVQRFYQAIFFSKKINNKWSPPTNITPEIESDGNQYVSSLSFDGKILFLRTEDNFQADIYVSDYENGRWSKSKPLHKTINTKYWEGNACITSDGKYLYFSSNKVGSVGVLDLYKAEKLPNGEWGPALNLGDMINTEFNEDAPFITEDNKRLYFASQGHQTMGGYDIYYSDIDPNGNFSKPVNMGYPINTTDDDNFYYPINNGKAAYISNYQKDGFGNQDIFRIEIGQVEGPVVVAVAEKIIARDTLPKADTLKGTQKQELTPSVAKTAEQLPEEKTTEVVTRSIFFRFNSAALDTAARKMLDHISHIMISFPDIKVEFRGNTDAKGNKAYNVKLSVKRAWIAKQYLVKKGIKPSRITIKGAGAKNFIAINRNPDGSDNAEGRKYNRRVDINIIENAVKNIVIQEVAVPDSLKIK